MLNPTQKSFYHEMELKYSLSPYVTISMQKDSNRMRLNRADNHRSVVISASGDEVLINFVELLQAGISKNYLLQLLFNMGADSPDDWIQLCIQEGILE